MIRQGQHAPSYLVAQVAATFSPPRRPWLGEAQTALAHREQARRLANRIWAEAYTAGAAFGLSLAPSRFDLELTPEQAQIWVDRAAATVPAETHPGAMCGNTQPPLLGLGQSLVCTRPAGHEEHGDDVRDPECTWKVNEAGMVERLKQVEAERDDYRTRAESAEARYDQVRTELDAAHASLSASELADLAKVPAGIVVKAVVIRRLAAELTELRAARQEPTP